MEPCLESCFATALPIPDVPPVTSVLFPAKYFWDVSSLNLILCL